MSFELQTHLRPDDGRECSYVSIPGQCCRKCGFYQEGPDSADQMFALVAWYVVGCIAAILWLVLR